LIDRIVFDQQHVARLGVAGSWRNSTRVVVRNVLLVRMVLRLK